jgi:hypothetical protein
MDRLQPYFKNLSTTDQAAGIANEAIMIFKKSA